MEQILQKRIDENESQYIWRIGQAKDSGLLNLTWEQLAPMLNVELGIDEDFLYDQIEEVKTERIL